MNDIHEIVNGRRKVKDYIVYEWIDLYVNKNLTMKEIGEKYGTTKTTVRNYLNKFGIKGKTAKLKENENKLEKQILELYLKENISINQISKKIGVSNTFIKNKLIKNNIKIKSLSKLIYDEHKNILNLQPSESLAYILGVIEGDGCVCNNKILLEVTDKDFIEEFKKQCMKIGFYTYGECLRISKNKNEKKIFNTVFI